MDRFIKDNLYAADGFEAVTYQVARYYFAAVFKSL